MSQFNSNKQKTFTVAGQENGITYTVGDRYTQYVSMPVSEFL